MYLLECFCITRKKSKYNDLLLHSYSLVKLLMTGQYVCNYLCKEQNLFGMQGIQFNLAGPTEHKGQSAYKEQYSNFLYFFPMFVLHTMSHFVVAHSSDTEQVELKKGKIQNTLSLSSEKKIHYFFYKNTNHIGQSPLDLKMFHRARE